MNRNRYRNNSSIFENIDINHSGEMAPSRHSGRMISVLLIIIAVAVFALSACTATEPPEQTAPAQDISTSGVIGGAYEITSVEQRSVIGKNHAIDVTEVIDVSLPDQPRSIEFSIPSGNFRIRSLDVKDTAYTFRSGSDGNYITIADEEKLSQPTAKFTITYTIYEFVDRDDTRDVLYYSVLPASWSQPIGSLSAVVTLPEDFEWDGLKCYSGQFGVQDIENRITFKENKDDSNVVISGKLIPENYGITLKAELSDGYWRGALNGDWAVLTMAIIMAIVTLILLILWIIGGRDPKIKRTPQNKPVEGVSPVELGYIFNSETDGNDLIRLILYFAMKGYLKISEYEPKRYRLIRRSDPDREEKLYRNAYNILFEDVYKGRALEMEDLGQRLVRIKNNISDDIAAGFSAREMLAYTPLSKGFRIAGIAMVSVSVGIINALKYSYQYISINYMESIIIGLLTAGLLLALCHFNDMKFSSSDSNGRVGALVSIVMLAGVGVYLITSIMRQTGQILTALSIAILIGVSIFLIVIMRARGSGNAALVMKFRQLRRFFYHPTPKELLENQLADPNYFYEMMPYALTFGAEETWGISFLTLDVPEPDWYSEDIEGHAYSKLREKMTTLDYAHDLRTFWRTVENIYNNASRGRR